MNHSTSMFALATLLVGLACGPKQDSSAPPQEPGQDDVVCTMDAKICPDGSGVGRSGPDCEFDPCPGEEPGSGEPETDDPEPEGSGDLEETEPEDDAG